MKKTTLTKLLGIVLIMALVMSMGITAAFAADDGSIKVTPPDGTQEDSKNTYTLYKVFDATTDGTHYSYTLPTGHSSAPAGFIVDDAGNVYFAKEATAEEIADTSKTTYTVLVGGVEKTLIDKKELTATDIAAIKTYLTDADIVATKEVTGLTAAEFTGLAYGYYYVATTTGTLVVIDSTKPDVEVKDKNEVPPLTKKITDADSIVDETGKQAIAQVGKNVEYTLTVTKKAGAQNYEVYDNMGTGLKYNKDLSVKVDGTDVAAANYTKTETDTSLKVAFDNTYMAGLADDTVITLVYTCLVTEDALQTEPAKNTAHLEYGHTPGENKTPVVETETYNAKFSVTKYDGSSTPLAGAGFVLKNAEGKYYKYTAATSDAPEKIEWVTSIDEATEYTSQASDGKLNGSFTGLCNGTYTLVEKTVPTGYNKAADYSFTVAEKNVTEANLIQATDVINNQGTELPSTGGIGTTIFYVVGSILVVAAGVLLITKKRMSREG